VPPAEFESATFCSASKRSIQLRYEGLWLTVPYYTAAFACRQARDWLFIMVTGKREDNLTLAPIRLLFG
jgi:hypothetical protein